MSTSTFLIPVASWETTLMPCARACSRTEERASGELGTTVMATGFCAIRSWMIWICFSGATSVPPSVLVSYPFSAPHSLTPTSMRSNHAMPLTLTTVTIVLLESPAAEPVFDEELSPVVPPTVEQAVRASIDAMDTDAAVSLPIFMSSLPRDLVVRRFGFAISCDGARIMA